MDPTPVSSPDDPQAVLAALRTACRSAVLATVNNDGTPEASHAPLAETERRTFLVLVSGLARHTGNLLRTRRVSLMLLDEEGSSTQVFARRRATFSCRVEPIARATPAWDQGIGELQQRHGGVVSMLRDLPDFQLLELVPESGMLVLGFGKAFRLSGPGCTSLAAVGPR